MPASSVGQINKAIEVDQFCQVVRTTVPGDDIRIGRVTGAEGFTKFGYREGLTSAGGEQTVWATTGNFTPMTTASTFTITYTNTTDGDGQNGATALALYYIDSSGLPAIGVHTLGSTGSDVTSFSGLGINRVAVSASGSTDTNGSEILITETTGGTTQAVVPAGVGVTQQAIYFNGSNHDAVAKYLTINVNKISGGASPRVVIKAYIYNRAVETQFEVFRYLIDTGVENHYSINEPVGFNLSPADVLHFVADTNTDNTDAIVRMSVVQYQRS